MQDREQRRLTTDIYGLISSDRAGYQVVLNLPRGTVVEIDRDQDGATRVRAGERLFHPGSGDLQRILRGSARV